MIKQIIHCCGCEEMVNARLTNGAEIYPHRDDLQTKPYWKCDACNNYVGCHHKSNKPTSPLGIIPTPELRVARQRIHGILDPLWKKGLMTRKVVYSKLSEALGYRYHTAMVSSVEDAQKVYEIVVNIKNEAISGESES